MFERAIIIGGGISIQDGIEGGLWDKIKDEFTVALNYSIRHFKNPTVVSFVDSSFYSMNKMELDNYPLLLTRQHNIKERNYITINATGNEYHGMESIEKGVYSMKLVGLFSLTLCIAMGFKEIYLLGYDFGEPIDKAGSGKTHFYQKDFIHRGVGKKKVNGKERYNTLLYEKEADGYFQCYVKDFDKVNIYNVSPNSRISVIPKITYDDFFKKLSEKPIKIDQEKAREAVRERLRGNKSVKIENVYQQIKNQSVFMPTEQPVGETKLNQENPISHKGTIIS